MESEVAATTSPDKCTDVKVDVDEQEDTNTNRQLVSGTKLDILKEEHVDLNPPMEEMDKTDRVIEKGRDTETEKDLSLFISTGCTVIPNSGADTEEEMVEGSNLHLDNNDAKTDLWSVAVTGTGEDAEENQSKSKSDKQVLSPSEKQARPEKEVKKKEKKKQRKKKKAEEKTVESEHAEKLTSQSENDLQAELFINAGADTESKANKHLVSEAVICEGQPDNGFDFKQQLSPKGRPSSSPPLSSHSGWDQLTDCSPAPHPAPSQRPHQSDNHIPVDTNHSSEKMPQRKPCETGDVSDSQNTPTTHVQTAVINPLASADRGSDPQTQESTVTTDASVLTQEKLSPLTDSQSCVGESCAESAFEEALVVVAPLPLTTTTVPEVIESSEAEGESTGCNSQEPGTNVAVTECAGSEDEEDLELIEKCLDSAERERAGVLDTPPQLPLICSEEKCSIVLTAKEGQTVSEESCSEMPQSSTEAEIKGESEDNHGADPGSSPAEGGDIEKELLLLEAYINTSLVLITGPDCQAQSAEDVEGAEKGGGIEVMEEKAGLAEEHNLFCLPAACASGALSAETELYPPTDVAESQLKSTTWAEPIATVRESICTEQDRLPNLCQEQRGAAILPLPPHFQLSSDNINAGVRADLNHNLFSEEVLPVGQGCEESSITHREVNNNSVFQSIIKPEPLTSLQQNQVEQKTIDNQQVRPESNTAETRQTETAGEAEAHSDSAVSAVVVNVCGSSVSNNRVHFKDTVEEEDSSTPDLGSMSVTGMDCASLPPLTVHESLYHPVVEASYNFPNFLILKKPELSINSTPILDNEARSTEYSLEAQKDSQVDKREVETPKTTENITKDQSGNNVLVESAEDFPKIADVCGKQLPCPTQKTNIIECSEESLQTGGGDFSDVDQVLTEHVPTNLVNTSDTQATDTDKPDEQSLLSDATEIPEEKEAKRLPDSSNSVLVANNKTCTPLSAVYSEFPTRINETDISEPETLSSTLTTSLQSQPADPSYGLPTDVEQTLPGGSLPSDPPKADEEAVSSVHSADQTKDEAVTPEVTASDLSLPVIEPCASKPTCVFQPPGPMLSHLELITDCDICLPEVTVKLSAGSDGIEVSGESVDNESMGMTKPKSEADVSLVVDETCAEQECRIYNLKANVELEQSPPVQPQGLVDTKTEPESVVVAPPICDSSVRDDAIKRGLLISSDLPIKKGCDEIKEETKKKHSKEEETLEMLEKERNDKEKTMENLKANVLSSTLQTEPLLQPINEVDKEEAGGTGDMQPPDNYKVEHCEPLNDIMDNGEGKSGIASGSGTDVCSRSPERPPGSLEDMPDAQSKSEPQTGSDVTLHQTPTVTVECNSAKNTAPDLEAIPGHSPDPNSFAQQKEEQSQCQEPRHPTVDLSEESNIQNTQDSQIQELVPRMKEVTEKVSGGGLCQTEVIVSLTPDDSKDKKVGVSHEERDKEEEEPEKEADGVTVTSQTNNDVDDIMTTTTTLTVDAGSVPECESAADVVVKSQQESNLSTTCQDQHIGKPENANTAASVESSSQQHDTSPLQISHSSKVSTKATPCENHAEETNTKILSAPPKPVQPTGTLEKDLITSVTGISNSGGNEQCDIKVSESQPAELKSSHGEQTPIKGTDVEEFTREDETNFDKEKARSQRNEQSEIEAINEAAEKHRDVNQRLSAEDRDRGSVKAPDHWGTGESPSSTRSAVCHSGGNTASFNAESLCLQDSSSAAPPIPTTGEKSLNQASPSKPGDDAVTNITNAAPEVEGESLNEAATCVSVSESPHAEKPAQQPEANWIQALKEAAASSQTDQQVITEETIRALPSLESPQLQFLTPSEDQAAPKRQEEVPTPEVTTTIPPINVLKKPVDLPQPLRKCVDLPEPRQQTVPPQGTKEEPTKKKERSVDIQEPEGEAVKVGISKILEDEKGTKKFQEQSINELPGDLVEKPVEIQPEEPFIQPSEEIVETEADQDPAEEQPDSSALLADPSQGGEVSPTFPPPPPPENLLLPATPPHLHSSTEPPPPTPTPPERLVSEGLLTPPASPLFPPPPPLPDHTSPPATPAHQCEDPCPASVPHLSALRSSDSEGAFETPESTTPVKAAPPTDLQIQQQASDDKDTVGTGTSITDPVQEVTSADLPFTPTSTFDENKPIAASGSYNFDLLSSDSASHTLTRSLSFQGAEVDSSGQTDQSAIGFRPHSESFSVGTESAPGTLHRPRKVRPGSLKKKPLLRQQSNPESPQPDSSSSTPELKKRGKSRTASPLLVQEEAEVGSATSSPGGTLLKTRKGHIETPPPLLEETSQTSEDKSPVIPVLPLCHEETPLPDSASVKEESPIPPGASYKWDPDNFENINPFSTGGSKIANSPVLGRKDPLCVSAVVSECPPVPIEKPPQPCPTASPPAHEPVTGPEEQPILPKKQPVRLEFDYSEESGEHQASTPPKKVGKKSGAKMPLRKPKLGLKKAPPAQTEQLNNDSPATHNGNEDEIVVPKASYNFEPDKWDDPNFNPFSSKKGISNSPTMSRQSYNFDPNNGDDSIDLFKSSNKMSNSPPKASATFEISSNDNDNENDNDKIGDLEDQNQNKPAKKKKTPIKSNTFRVKRSPKKSPLSDLAQDPTQADEPSVLQSQDDHATDEEKLASSTNHKWAARHDMDNDLDSDRPSAFVNEDSLPHQNIEPDYEIEYMEKIGPSGNPPAVKKPSLYLKLDSVTDSLTNNTGARGSEPSSPCTGSFEEMEAQITAGMKTPVLSSRPGPEGSSGDQSRKKEAKSLSRTESTEREEKSSGQGAMEAPAPVLAIPLLDRLSDCEDPLQYLEPDLAETNPTAFAQKLQEELVLAALRIEALQVAKNISQCPSLFTVTPQHQDPPPQIETSVSKNTLYTKTSTSYIEGESPHLPQDLDHSLGIAREEIVTKEKEVLEWQKKYENSRQEVMEMRRIVAEYEKTISQMIEDDQKEKSLSHHTIQQLIIEKDQALADLNSVERSMADLFRRYEKMKDMLDGFRKNEELLKKNAQEYLSRVRKEEQRYQALKIHAEEKLDKANAEIAQVRFKARQEQAAFQASLRREQMKVDSLERTLEQKNKEIEELTKICDELIAKMGKS
uniref:Titin homolog n=2 Tax=Cynoglossus semilaevis TaxID=244447 RepID=A0A3P8VVT2_CYNSE